MFRNYFKTTVRNLLRQKTYALINILGLSFGIACFLLIFLYVQHERSVNTSYPDADRIYRVIQLNPRSSYKGSQYIAMTPPPLASRLTEDIPEVESATAFEDHRALISTQANHYWEEGLWADRYFFEVFSVALVEGDAQSALALPNSIVLTQSLKEKLFGNENAMGEQLVHEDTTPVTVTGIIPDPPLNATLTYQFLISFETSDEFVRYRDENTWNSNFLYTFFKAREQASEQAVANQVAAFVDRHMYAGDTSMPDDMKETLEIQKLSDVHLHSNFNHDIGAMTGRKVGGSNANVNFLALIGVIILALACINYVNLAIARSIRRAREVGLRKAIGAGRGQIVGQFLGESILLSLLSTLCALGLVYLLLPSFADLVVRPLQLSLTSWFIPGLLLLAVLVGLISGSYPALFMASLDPSTVFREKQGGKRRLGIQNSLIIVQYMASMALIVSGLIVYQQLQFVQSQDPGYQKEHILNIRIQMNDDALREELPRLMASWKQQAGIISVAASSYLPTSIDGQQEIMNWEGSSEDERLPIFINNVSPDYLEVFDIELVAGRMFEDQNPADFERARLINESAAKALGWTPEEAIGQRFMHRRVADREIIGVMKDFHLHSMHLSIQPVMLTYTDRFMQYVSVRLEPGMIEESLQFLRSSVESVTPYPFSYSFLDDQFDALYEEEQRLGNLLAFFTIIALFIASLGLFGLAAYAAEQRTKEIGIRKVLGASISSIVLLLNKEYSKLVVLAVIMATPVSYIIMQKWLQGFAYRVDLQPGVFLLTGVITLLIALSTVSFQAVRAAGINPVQSLAGE